MDRISKNKAVSAEMVAYYFLKLAKENNRPVTNKVLQKLLYYSQVWYYTLHNEKLFREKIEAWVHGPAIPKIYGKFKAFGFNAIDLDVSDYDFDLSKNQEAFLKNIWGVYGKFDANYLEALTHAELPWQEARQGMQAGESSSKEIDLKLAKEYYGAKLKPVNS